MRGNKAPASAVIHDGVVHAIGAVETTGTQDGNASYYDEAACVDWASGSLAARRPSKKTRRTRKAERARLRRGLANPKVRLLCEIRYARWTPSISMGTAMWSAGPWPRQSPWRSLARTRQGVNCMACIAAATDP